jgi:hypothetical protein
LSDLIEQLQRVKVDWQATAKSTYVFDAVFAEKKIRLRLNDFPDDPLCTVIVNGREKDLDEFPKSWTLPGHRR